MRAAELFFDPQIRGHGLVQPLLWYGRQVRGIFMDPLPPERNRAVEVVARAVVGVALGVLLVLCPIVISMALAGWAVKAFSGAPASNSEPQPSEEPPVEEPQPSEEPPVEESQPSEEPTTPTEPPEEMQERQVQEAAQQLCDWYNGLKGVQEKALKDLFRMIEAFDQQFGQHRGCDAMAKAFALVNEIARNAYGMQQAREFYCYYYMRGADEKGIIQQPGDGSCWLHTCLIGLSHLDHPERARYTYQTLRAAVVQWMRSHIQQDSRLQQFVTDSMEAHVAAKQRHLEEAMENLSAMLKAEDVLSEEETTRASSTLASYQEELANPAEFTREEYFQYLESDEGYGGPAEWYALSKMFGIQIVIYRTLSCELTNAYDLPIGEDGLPPVYVALNAQGNHYDALIPPFSHEPVAKSPRKISR